MSMQIDYYFLGASPFTYLGHKAIRDMAAKHGATLVYKPVNITGLWEQSGAVPPAQRPPVRQRYRLLELQRIAHMRNLPINLQPAHFPVDITLADCCVAAIADAGNDPFDFMDRVLRGVWVDDANMADESEISHRIEEAGFSAMGIIAAARSQKIMNQRSANTLEAVERDAVGVPAYVVNDEVFWGQDRIEYIDHALTSGRTAFTAG